MFFANEYSANFLERSWLNFRKYGGLPTGLIQNAEKCLNSETARFLFGNSEFLIILKQSPADMKSWSLCWVSPRPRPITSKTRRQVAALFATETPWSSSETSAPDTELYRLMTTKPGER